MHVISSARVPIIHSLICHANTTNENPFWTLSAILSTDHNKAFGQIFNYSAIFSSNSTPRAHLLCLIFLKAWRFLKLSCPKAPTIGSGSEEKLFFHSSARSQRNFLIKRISTLCKQDLCWLTSLCLRIQFICAIKFVHFSRLPRCERPINIGKSDQPIILCCRPSLPPVLSRNHHSK